ncbi:HD domain-containing protein [Chroococcidiopsis sp.]|uniref:HD domain-containing protein n=1 Tax=Chroococcidiopsis sp. TaxID=3088168 RepID=UPI003F3BDFD9
MPSFSSSDLFSPRFSEALQFICVVHLKQLRKHTEVPYISHLMSVSALVLEMKGDEEQAIAALLHDAPEDVGVSFMEIQKLFGERVAAIVWHCTDLHKRSESTYYGHILSYESPDWRLVKFADSLHNARACVVDASYLDTRFLREQLYKYKIVEGLASKAVPQNFLIQFVSAIDSLDRILKEREE